RSSAPSRAPRSDGSGTPASSGRAFARCLTRTASRGRCQFQPDYLMKGWISSSERFSSVASTLDGLLNSTELLVKGSEVPIRGSPPCLEPRYPRCNVDKARPGLHRG